MILSINNQALLFFVSAFFGFSAGFFYDCINVFRKIIKHHKIFIQIEDFIYWTLSALILFFIMLKENFGEIRGFLILGAFIGMLLYFLILSKLFLSISDKVLHFLKKVFTVVFRIVFSPVFTVYSLLKKISLYIARKFIKPFKNKKQKKTDEKKIK